jgi:hypothetical protein
MAFSIPKRVNPNLAINRYKIMILSDGGVGRKQSYSFILQFFIDLPYNKGVTFLQRPS